MYCMSGEKSTIRTSVVLTRRGWDIFMKHKNAFGPQGILSVGLELFDALEPGEQRDRVNRAITEDEARRRVVKSAAKGALSHRPKRGDTKQDSERAIG